MVVCLLLVFFARETLKRDVRKRILHWYDCNLLYTLTSLLRHRSAWVRFKQL